MATLSRYARTPRPGGSTFELMSWFYMRVSGLLLALMVTFHLLWMHYAVGLDNINFEVIAGRWTDPQWGTAWRTFDLFLLLFALSHGMNGVRFVIEDYVHHPGWRVAVKTILALLLFALLVMGAYVIFTFNG